MIQIFSNHPIISLDTIEEELGAAFFPGHPAGPEAWAAAAHPALQGTFPDLNLMAHQPPTLIQHPALAQVPVSQWFITVKM